MISQVFSPFRIIDANLNRVAEGLRVVEDILRFFLEDKENSAMARELRHKVRELYSELYLILLEQRDVKSDPGVQLSQQQNLDSKQNWQVLLIANLKRAQEGVRVLEESAHVIGKRELAKNIEEIRFLIYQLEKNLKKYFGKGNLEERKKLPSGIYAITSEQHSLGRSNLEVAQKILGAGIKVFQYREKNKKVNVMYQECKELRKMTKDAEALFIVNDYIDLALAVGADGIHIGQDDLPLTVVREMVGNSFLIGVSTHSPEQAQAAVADGADYIGVGPIFATRTKTDVCDPVGLEYLQYVVENLNIPFVAIGGIKEHNIHEVLKVGARTIALVTEIVGSQDISKKINELNKIIGM